MNDISTEENIDIAQHTEYRDPKIWLGVICLGITVLGLTYFVLIRKTEVESVEPVSRMPASETRNGADFEYQIDETVESGQLETVIEVPAVAVGESSIVESSESDAPLVVYQASGSGSLRETPLYSEANTTLSREAQMEQVREMLSGCLLYTSDAADE